ncbi:MAG: hypothetical protein SynsKO_35880 [Synoicihabitans sp.]
MAKVHVNHYPPDSTDLTRFCEEFEFPVLLVRDPRDRMISESFFIPRESQAQRLEFIRLMRAKEREPGKFSMFTDIAGHLAHTLRFSQQLDEVRVAHPRLRLLRYEDFMQGNWAELEAYLGFSLFRGRIDNQKNLIHRSGLVDQWRSYLTPDDVSFLREPLSPFLHNFGYEADDWELSHRDSLDPQVGSEYLRHKYAREFPDIPPEAYNAAYED